MNSTDNCIGERFRSAIEHIDAANSADPNREVFEGQLEPREVLYSKWLEDWVHKLEPEASEALRLAARAQHICRWLIPRNQYPHTREGYLKWREQLKHLHADKAAEILRQVGYGDETVSRVRDLILKKLFPRDKEARVLEDALCLVFLERQLSDLAAKTSEDKMINALRKAWKKMTPEAREIALKLSYSAGEKQLLEKALAT